MPGLYDSLIKQIRDQDYRTLVLKRFLQRPQERSDAIKAAIQGLQSTDKPTSCREDLLKYLAWHVGFTDALSDIVQRLPAVLLRKLIKLAVPFWKSRGTAPGLVSAVKLLTGRPCTYTDWFDYRNILGESAIGEGWAIGGEVTLWDEYISTLKVLNDGEMDQTLLADIVSLCRPLGETIEVMVVDLLDDFTRKDLKHNWDIVGYGTGDEPSVNDQNQLVLTPYSALASINPVYNLNSSSGIVGCRIKMEDNSQFAILHNDNAFPADTGYYIRISIPGIGGSPQVDAGLRGGGAYGAAWLDGHFWYGPGVQTYKDPGFPIYPGVWYDVRVEFITNSDSPKITLFIDDQRMDFVLPVIPQQGKVVIHNAILDPSGGNVYVDNIWGALLPMNVFESVPDIRRVDGGMSPLSSMFDFPFDSEFSG